MNIEVKRQDFGSYGSSILFSPILEQIMSERYKYEDVLLKQDTAISLSVAEKIETSKNRILSIIKDRNIKVDDEYLFNSLLNKLEKERIDLLYQIIDYLIKYNYKFSIEVYKTDGDLEHLYFVIHFPPETDEEKIDEEILRLAKYKRSIDKNKLLWFIGFAREVEDV